MAGRTNGILSVRLLHNYLAIYYLWKSRWYNPELYTEMDTYTIEGRYIAKAGRETATEIKIFEVWNCPTLFLEVEETSICNFDVMGLVQKINYTYFERSESMEVYIYVYRNESMTLEWLFKLLLSHRGSTQVLFYKGKYRIRFNWIEFGKPERFYAGSVERKG